MLTAQEVADKMHGRQYRDEDVYTDELLKAANLLVVYGASDDLLEVGGVINEEFGAYEGTTVYLIKTPNGWRLVGDGELEDVENAIEDTVLSDFISIDTFKTHWIKSEWCPVIGGVIYASWVITANLPEGMGSYPFAIQEDGELYCRGLVIDMDIQLTD